MRYIRTNKPSEVKFNGMFGVEKMEVRTPSLVDEFYFDKSKCPETGIEVVSYSNPLYMLFNQQRLNRLGEGAVKQWLDQLDRSGNNSYNELKSKVKDEDLLKLVRPRQCQSPSELESYINYLNENMDAFNAEVARIVAEEKEATDQQREKEIDSDQTETTT